MMWGLPARFWAKVNFYGPRMRPGISRCWEWTAMKSNGYGRFGIGSRTDGSRASVRAHRLVLAGKLRRQLGSGMDACHKCDNPACVNPFHLWEGTRAHNIADMLAKGRHAPCAGEAHGQHKVTEDQVRAIRAADGTQQEIGDRFGVDPTTISLIRLRKCWRHVV